VYSILAENAFAEDFFGRHVRPILSDKCYTCHGPDPASRKAGLDLSDYAGLLLPRSGEARAMVVPGDLEGSELLRRIAPEAGDDQMPPASAPKHLTAAEIETINEWVRRGAEWSPLWSLVPPVSSIAPGDAATEQNPIDAVVHASLRQAGIEPAPEESPARLLRRAALDLTGLPPSPETVREFLADTSPDAYARAVENLLASPHYGERWAVQWLDLARYADTNGYEKDLPRKMHLWRDWVINAINQNMPFDRFTIEQLAGDLLPGATESQRIATGFHRNTMLNDEGGIDPEEFRLVSIIDRVNTTAEVWLGLTMACAQCHTHKYDTLTHADYFRMSAFFDSTADNGRDPDPRIFKPTPEQQAALESAKAALAEAEAALKQADRDTVQRMEAWESEAQAAQAEWQVLAPLTAASDGGADLKIQEDQSVLATGANPDRDAYAIGGSVAPGEYNVALLEVLTDPTLPNTGPGRAANGNVVIARFTLDIERGDGTRMPVSLSSAVADHTQPGHEAVAIISGDAPGWAAGSYEPGMHTDRVIAISFSEPIHISPGEHVHCRIEAGFGSQHNPGRVRVSFARTGQALEQLAIPKKIDELLRVPRPERNQEQASTLHAYYSSLNPALPGLRSAIEAARKKVDESEQDSVMVMAELPEPRKTHVLIRGDVFQKGEEVGPGTPAILPPLIANARPSRLDFARWLVNRNNPLTARVTVNRYWASFFGRGIVPTLNDFGVQGEAPSNQALLDTLAVWFMDHGWDVKALHRLIVTSATYRQSANVSPALLERDPNNELLARGPRFRVEAEAVRDIALASAGLLNPAIGGPSIFPFQPPGIWENSFTTPDTKATWQQSPAPHHLRRAMYTFWRRTAPYPSALLFDMPRREVCTTMRPRTNTPLQALATMNDPVFLEASGALALVMIRAGDDDVDRIREGFLRCVARYPSEKELNSLQELLDKTRNRFSASTEAAQTLAASCFVPESGLPPQEVAAFIAVANALLNLDETITKG